MKSWLTQWQQQISDNKRIYQSSTGNEALTRESCYLTVNAIQIRKVPQSPNIRRRNVGIIFKVKLNAFQTPQRLLDA